MVASLRAREMLDIVSQLPVRSAGATTPPSDAPADVVAAERALERLFRLTVSRQMHTRQAAAVGAVVTRAGYACCGA